MYTESFAGDIDFILAYDARRLELTGLRSAQRSIFDVAMKPLEKPLANGLTRTQKASMIDILRDVIFAYCGNGEWPAAGVTLRLDGNQRIILSERDKAIKLYHRLTGESIFGGKLTKKTQF